MTVRPARRCPLQRYATGASYVLYAEVSNSWVRLVGSGVAVVSSKNYLTWVNSKMGSDCIGAVLGATASARCGYNLCVNLQLDPGPRQQQQGSWLSPCASVRMDGEQVTTDAKAYSARNRVSWYIFLG